jgi:hypothetical protein
MDTTAAILPTCSMRVHVQHDSHWHCTLIEEDTGVHICRHIFFPRRPPCAEYCQDVHTHGCTVSNPTHTQTRVKTPTSRPRSFDTLLSARYIEQNYSVRKLMLLPVQTRTHAYACADRCTQWFIHMWPIHSTHCPPRWAQAVFTHIQYSS